MIRFASILNLTLLGIGVGATLAGFLTIAPSVLLPVHWGFDGTVDAMLPRNLALLQMPGVVALVWAIFWAIQRWGNAARQAASTHVMNVALTAITALMVLIQILIVLVGLGVAIDVVRGIAIGLALLEIVLGNAMPKSQPNWFAGIRIPTTLNDPANWQATHRVAGILMIIAGVALFFAALAVPASFTLLLAVILCFIAPLSLASFYSLVLAARARKPVA